MITYVHTYSNSKESDVLFFQDADFAQFKNHVVPLFGPNGAGKSTLIRAIENNRLHTEFDRPCAILSYLNGRDNFKIRSARSYAESFDLAFLSAKFDAKYISEGQSIIYSLYDLLDGLRKDDALKFDNSDCVVLLDEIDSGLSIDNIDTTMRKIKSVLRVRDDVQFILSFNSPRVLKHFPEVLSMYNGKKITLHTEDDMLKEIQIHKKSFNKARKTSKGRPKIFE